MTATSSEPASSDFSSDFASARRQLELRSLVARLATSFISVPPEQVDSAICETLEVIGRFSGADRAVLAVFEEGDASWEISHEWSDKGLLPFKSRIARIPAMPWTLPELCARRPIRVRTEAGKAHGPTQHEREMVDALGLHSAFVIPVFVGGKLAGAAGIGSVSGSNVAWTDDLTALLELPGRFMLDALARRAREQARRANEALWRSFCACEVIGVFIISRDGLVLESNDTALRIVGRSREELSGGTIRWSDMTPREYRSQDLRALERLDHGDMVLPWKKEAQRPDGSRVPILATLASLAPFSPELLALFIDLSERERARKELQRSNQFDRLLISLSRRLITLPAASIDKTISGALAEVGRFFDMDRVALYEALPSSDVEEPRLVWSANPGELRPSASGRIQLATLPWWRERLRAGRAVYLPTLDSLPREADAERARLESDGVTGFLAIPLYPGRVSNGAIHFAAFHPLALSDHHLALLRVFCDIVSNARERKRAEVEIRSAADALEDRVRQRRTQLEASNAELDAFAYSVSHDLGAPLRRLDSLSQALIEDFGVELSEDARALVGRMTQAGQRMGDLIDGLLQLSRVVRTAIEWKPVDLSAAVTDIARKRRSAAPDRDVVFDIQSDVVVYGHEDLLRIAVAELIDNAWKFSAHRQSAHISFGVEQRGGEHACFLRDDGVGFDSELAGKLFGAFQRLHGVAEFEGHGIGLATVERIVRLHGGRVWAQGAPGRGATIFFTLAADTDLESP